MDGQVNAGGSVILIRKALLQGENVLTHVVTHMDREHLITMISKHRSPMIVIVHLGTLAQISETSVIVYVRSMRTG